MNDWVSDFKPLAARIYAYAAYRIGPGPDAEDVTSETFERALRYGESFDAKRGKAAAWLIGIASRVIADRTLREIPSGASADFVVGGIEPRSVRAIELGRALCALSDRDRDLIALRYGADLTAKEIARLLELRANTVEVALHRSLARLRVELGEDDGRSAGSYRPAAPDTP